MSDLILRDARDGDADAIQEVTMAAYSVYASIMGPLWGFYKQNILETLADIAPELDFHPAPDVTARGYRLDLKAQM